MVAEQPPVLGSDLAGMASRSWQNAMPWRTGVASALAVLAQLQERARQRGCFLGLDAGFSV